MSLQNTLLVRRVSEESRNSVFRNRLASSGAAATVALLLTADAVRAHAGEVHAAGSPDGSNELGLLAIVIVAVAGYWVANRGSRRPGGHSDVEQSAAIELSRRGRTPVGIPRLTSVQRTVASHRRGSPEHGARFRRLDRRPGSRDGPFALATHVLRMGHTPTRIETGARHVYRHQSV